MNFFDTALWCFCFLLIAVIGCDQADTKGVTMNERQARYQEVREEIARLTQARPTYVLEAKKRATRLKKEGYEMQFPICYTGEADKLLDIKHVFPPLKRTLEDPLIDTDWHVVCPECGHTAWVTITHQHAPETAH